MVRVYSSRYSPGLRPGDGQSICWQHGETVEIIAGQDKGRLFVIDSEPMAHADAPGQYVREGWFTDDSGTRWCKREADMWFGPGV